MPAEWVSSGCGASRRARATARSEEHTSELQSRQYLVCRLLLEQHRASLPPPRRNRANRRVLLPRIPLLGNSMNDPPGPRQREPLGARRHVEVSYLKLFPCGLLGEQAIDLVFKLRSRPPRSAASPHVRLALALPQTDSHHRALGWLD